MTAGGKDGWPIFVGAYGLLGAMYPDQAALVEGLWTGDIKWNDAQSLEMWEKMKVYAQEKLLPDGTPEDLVWYSMSLPVASAVVGMPQLDFIDQNVKIAKGFTPMPKQEMKQLSDRLAAAKKASIDEYFRHHDDACDNCGVQLS